MSDRRDVTGVWYGRYVGVLANSDNSFIAVLEETGGVFHGTITEPDDTGVSDIRRAAVDGHRAGGTVRFTKQYDGTSGWNHAVDYSGLLDEEGLRISGNWLHRGLGAGFVMEREKFTEDELEAEDAVELREPLLR